MSIHRRLPALLPGAALLAACATANVEPASPSLAGTSWQLVAIQSMDDAQGTTRIADPARFTLRFGPVATTRALCPPPQLDQRVARDLDHVRSYRLKDGKLFLSLMADGGIYEWHPAATPEHAR